MRSNFELDLEFIQLLCNPEYLKWLNNEDWFEKEEFLDYLKRLLYFKKDKFRKFLVYPQCIEILEEILQDKEILNDDHFIQKLEKQQFYLWSNRK